MKQHRLATRIAYFLCDIQIIFGSLSEALGKENILERVGAGRFGEQYPRAVSDEQFWQRTILINASYSWFVIVLRPRFLLEPCVGV